MKKHFTRSWTYGRSFAEGGSMLIQKVTRGFVCLCLISGFSIVGHADERQSEIVTRVMSGGSMEILGVGECQFEKDMTRDGSGMVSYGFDTSICREIITAQVRVTKGNFWTSTKEVIAGTEKSTFVVEQNRKRSFDIPSREDFGTMIGAHNRCEELRQSYQKQIVAIAESRCAQ